MNKHYKNLSESLDYIQIKRGPSDPLPLGEILERRMEDFLERRLNRIRYGKRGGKR